MSNFTLNSFETAGYIGSYEYFEARDNKKSRSRFTIAERIPRKDQDDDVRWHSISAFGETADKLNLILPKAKSIYVDANLSYTNYTANGTELTLPSLTVNSPAQVNIVTWKPDDDIQKNGTSMTLNKLLLSGNVGGIKLTQDNGKTRLNFTIFENIKIGDKTIVHRHPCIAFEETAKKCHEMLSKAKTVFVRGKLDYYKKNVGEKNYSLASIVINSTYDLRIVDWKSEQEEQKVAS
jgi:single-stranded DNA-binding protein